MFNKNKILKNSIRKCIKYLSTQSKPYPSYVLNAPATEVTTLLNGLRVASEGSSSHGDTATVGIWINAGSRYENDKNNGVAHFLEHMSFKGTSKRTQRQLEEEIENMGGHLNAYTSREQTVYYAKVHKNDVDKAMDILGDILQHSKLDENAIERERDVILREMEEVNKKEEEVVFDRLHETAYMGSGLSKTILGPEENIKSLKKSDLQEYINNYYTSSRMVVAGAGAIDHSTLVSLSENIFNNLPKTSTVPTNNVKADKPVRFVGSDIRLRDDNLPLAHIALAFESFPATSAETFELLIMQTLIGQWDRTSNAGTNMSSKLGQVIAEKNLANSFSCFNTVYNDTGLFGVHLVAEKYKLDDLMWYTMEALVRMVHKTTEDEVERAKIQLKANMLMQLDGSSAICEDIGRQMLSYNRRLTPAEIFTRIDKISAASVKRVANQVINDKEHALAALGPIWELPDYNFIRRRSYWLRY